MQLGSNALLVSKLEFQRMVFSTITGKMSISEDVDLEDLISRPDKLRYDFFGTFGHVLDDLSVELGPISNSLLVTPM